jgi:acyl-coenzyme A synthetase/AMP-(fatty) acid ligase/acyl carrier protein
MQQLIYIDNDLKFMKNIEYILIGGEKLNSILLEHLHRHTNARIFNMYGPTETTIWSSVAELTNSNTVHIGRPIKNTGFFILLNNTREAKINEPGEICITGDGLAKGYINNKGLTDKSFILIKDGIRIFKTGDIGIRTDNGNYVCLGRNDNQIKIRGHRVELEEVEYNINSFSGIHKSVVLADKKNENMFAYFSSDNKIDIYRLSKYLSTKLPEYLLPSKFFQIKEIPLTANGKVDRNYILSQIENIPSIEKKLLSSDKVIQDIVGIINENISDKIDVNQDVNINLSDLGINSISLIKILIGIEDLYGFEFDDEILNISKLRTMNDLIANIKQYITHIERRS